MKDYCKSCGHYYTDHYFKGNGEERFNHNVDGCFDYGSDSKQCRCKGYVE